MKYILILSCLLFTSAGWSKTIDSDNLILKDGLYYEKFEDKPFTGKVTGEEQGKISKGKRDGKWIKYFENGRFLLLEKLVADVLEICCEHEWVSYARVKIDKPHALRFADSVSLSLENHK